MELPPNPGGDKGFFTEGTDVTHGKRKPTLTDVQSNKAQRLESVASRVPTLQALAWRKIPADEYASLPEPVRDSVLALDPNRPPPVELPPSVYRVGVDPYTGQPRHPYEIDLVQTHYHGYGNWYTTDLRTLKPYWS